jgi:F-type H+-transporting ATPase subunit b
MICGIRERKGKHRLTGVAGSALFCALILILLSAGPILASSGHEGAAKGWEATDTYRIMNFVVLAVALYFALRKPVAQALQGRIKGIKDELAELESRKQEAEKKLAQYDERFSLLDQEAKKISESYIQQGKEAQARILEQARVSAEKLETHARRQIETAFERARAELQGVILEKAIEKAEAKIRENISAEDQVRLVDDYLEKVVA